MDELYIGLMSGTSNDGVDAALVNFSNGFTCLETHYEPYPADLRARLQQLVAQRSADFTQLLTADNDVAIVHSLAVKKLLHKANRSADRIVALGFHGQTLFHQPDPASPNSLQIGNPSLLAQRTNITTVSDFRRRDMATGGQGAPFAPALHGYLFRDNGVDRVVVNLGGIANITVLPADRNQPILGFDSGPASCLLDEWFAQHQQGQFDNNGEWARSGVPDEHLLQSLLADPYFSLTPPKSTGREYFNLAWVRQTLPLSSLASEDVQATLLALTATSVANAIADCAPKTKEVYICGGGANNAYLLEVLQMKLPGRKLASTQALGLHPDWVEACAFAWFARQTVNKQPLGLKSVTGASQDVIAGAIYP